MEDDMGFLQWEQKYEFGIPEVDEQHKKWLSILNKFYDSMGNGDLNNKMKSLVAEALDYTVYHFNEEEKLMEKMKFPHLNEQKRMHKEIVNMLSAFKKDIENKKTIISMSITNEMKKWFKEHILLEDMKYAEYYKKSKKMK